jgi:hypothetical protein
MLPPDMIVDEYLGEYLAINVNQGNLTHYHPYLEKRTFHTRLSRQSARHWQTTTSTSTAPAAFSTKQNHIIAIYFLP